MRLGKKTRNGPSLNDYLRRKGMTLEEFVRNTEASYDDVLRYCEDFHLSPPDRESYEAVMPMPPEAPAPAPIPRVIVDPGVARLWEEIYEKQSRKQRIKDIFDSSEELPVSGLTGGDDRVSSTQRKRKTKNV